MSTQIRNNNSGFTLIELLVVISIIGLLSSVVLVSLSGVKTKAKEAKVQTEIHQIELALQAYNAEHGGYPNPNNDTYPRLYCIGSDSCLIGGEPISMFPEDAIAFKQITQSNIASAFPVFESESDLVALDNDNKGYLYVSCGSGDSLCQEDTAGLIYPKPTSNAYIYAPVGSFTEVECGSGSGYDYGSDNYYCAH